MKKIYTMGFYKTLLSCLITSMAIITFPLLAHASILDVDNTEVGLRTFTYSNPDYNISPVTAESNCRLLLNDADMGLMFETGTNTGVYSIQIEVIKGVYTTKVKCKTDALGEKIINYATAEFGAEMVSAGVVERKLAVGDIWYLSDGHSIKIASINASVNPQQTEIWPEENEDYKKIINVGNKLYYHKTDTKIDKYSFKVAGISKNTDGKDVVSITELKVLKSEINPETPAGMVSLFDSYDKKTLLPGKSWDLSGGYAVVANSVNTDNIPESANIKIIKNCQLIAEKTITEGEYYEIPNVLKIHATSIFKGAVESMVQFAKAFIGRPYDVTTSPYPGENWSCGNWSACLNGTQTRTCSDLNACGTTINKPAIIQICSSPALPQESQNPPVLPSSDTDSCNERWLCESWSSCENNIQARTCNDYNKCGTVMKKPATQQSCVTTKEASSDSSTRAGSSQNGTNINSANNKPSSPDTSSEERNSGGRETGIETNARGSARNITPETPNMPNNQTPYIVYSAMGTIIAILAFFLVKNKFMR